MKPLRTAAFLATFAVVVAASWPQPAQAWLGLLGKIGSAAGKAGGAAGTAGKGAAAVGGVAAADAVGVGSQAAKAAKVGAAGADEGSAAMQLSKASGLGPAVPDEVAAMLRTPGKTLADVPDAGTRSWLSTPPAKLTPADGDLMVHDYVKLLEGKPAAGPGAKPAGRAPTMPTRVPPDNVPWHAMELLARAAHAGSKAAQSEHDRLCNPAPPRAASPRCGPAQTATTARKP
jgi:hypothetical protein